MKFDEVEKMEKKRDIVDIINESDNFVAFEVDKNSKDPVKEFWEKMDNVVDQKKCDICDQMMVWDSDQKKFWCTSCD